jgi:hypothetical protein
MLPFFSTTLPRYTNLSTSFIPFPFIFTTVFSPHFSRVLTLPSSLGLFAIHIPCLLLPKGLIFSSSFTSSPHIISYHLHIKSFQSCLFNFLCAFVTNLAHYNMKQYWWKYTSLSESRSDLKSWRQPLICLNTIYSLFMHFLSTFLKKLAEIPSFSKLFLY